MKHKSEKFLTALFSGSSLRTKLLWIYFLLILLPLGFFTFYVYNRVSSVIQEQTFTAAQKTFDDATASVEDYLLRLHEVLNILSMDDIIYRVSSHDQSDYTYRKRLEDSTQLSTTFEHLKTLSGIDRIWLYVQNDYLYSNKQRDILFIADAAGSCWYQELSKGDHSKWYAPADFQDQTADEQHWFSVARIIYNPRSLKEPLAILRADLDEKRMYEAVSRTSITENGFFMILRGNTVLLSSQDEADLTPYAEIISSLPETDIGSWKKISLQNKNYYIQSTTLSFAGWQMVTVLPHSDIFALSHELRLEMLFVVLLAGMIAYALAYAISQSSLRRISRLAHTMHDVENGNVTARIEAEGSDEIGQLMGSFARMMNRIDVLMDEKVEYGRQIKNLELKALQAQINPHFLYNSLDLISCTAILHNVPQISKTVNALARFYKISLSRGRETISIREELDHARLYVQIQNMRFEDRIHVDWKIEEAVLNCQIIKIVLQPILENAIIHGIFEKTDKAGTISVSARLDPGGIRITVQDDGVGMEENIIRENFVSTPPGGLTETSGGYGVHNIFDRLILAYGEPYGLFCKSTPGLGTVVTIFIPAVNPDSDAAR